MSPSRLRITLLGIACLGLPWVLLAAPLAAQPAARSLDTPDALATELYQAVSSEAGTTPDWDRVRSLFLEQAVVVLRNREGLTVFSVDGFVDDFIAFIERAKVRETGFTERIVRRRQMVFGDIAHVLVLYEAHIPGSGRPPRQGVDSLELIRKDGRWWIAAITNELPTPDHPIPAELRE